MTTLAPSHFEQIAEIAMGRWGLNLTDRKMQLVSNRLAKFLYKSRFNDVQEYLEHLEAEADEEDMLVFFDVLSTNVTSFFRERKHFDYLQREFYTPLAQGNLTTPGRRIRIWSAACSTGPEPYSLAIHAIDHLPDLDTWDFKILATDLSNSAIQDARRAVYPFKMVEDLDRGLLKRHFLRGRGKQAEMVRVAPHVRCLVTVGRLNLMDSWPIRGPFDVIFCRNVMIYFDKPTRQRLVVRLYDLLRGGGLLAIGSAETLSGLDSQFRTVEPSVYVK
ncbi:MAG: protein-glutamate O-methyltransferase CheR [Planctomycetes bacterium]|nr:protein-glutamate O-methyltransferase CheR [Planctomycetota bacterium]